MKKINLQVKVTYTVNFDTEVSDDVFNALECLQEDFHCGITDDDNLSSSPSSTAFEWFIDQCNDGIIDICRFDVFEERLRDMFRELYKIKCKNFASGECLQGGRCDGNCRRMRNYDKKH